MRKTAEFRSKITNNICTSCKNDYENLIEHKKKICPICEQPHRMKTQCCSSCNRRIKQLEISIAKLLVLKKIYKIKDIFKLIEEKPFLLNSKVDHIIQRMRNYPIIHYICTACGEGQAQSLNNINKGHNCISNKSSGEIIVENFVRRICEIKTQNNTLIYINPITKRELPNR